MAGSTGLRNEKQSQKAALEAKEKVLHFVEVSYHLYPLPSPGDIPLQVTLPSLSYSLPL